MPRRDVSAIVAFLPELELPGFVAGTWQGGKPDADGAIQMPWFEYSPRAETLLRAVNAAGFVYPFDWMAWLDGPEGIPLRDEPGRIERATEEELARLLTAIVRGDRFTEGNIAGAIESGVLVRIVRRLKALQDE